MKIKEKDVSEKILRVLKEKFNQEIALPKYYRLKKILKSQILEQNMSTGDKLPSVPILVKELNIAGITADKTLNELEKEGLVNRIQGKGTFVSKPRSEITSKNVVGLIMSTRGHLWGLLYHHIIEGLSNHHYYCVANNIVSHELMDTKYTDKLNRLISSEPFGLVVYGQSSFPFHMLEGFPNKLLFIVAYETDKEYPADYILSDYFAGGQMVADYFISSGYKKIIFYTHPIQPQITARIHLVSGLKDSLKKNNLSEKNLIVVEKNFSQKDEKRLEEILQKERKPVAVFCLLDAEAVVVYKIARKLNLKIPEQVSVIGYYNTPWCEVLHPNLTSVSIREDKIAQIVVKKIVGKENKKEKIILKPKLIIRDSVISL
ncbi:MAG: substrate-binding domain-containing protein [Candidatus Omnitrophica bacterium]|nr:substrate-binding domain-containing protein [Candidatus Omnitrophota bacterium]